MRVDLNQLAGVLVACACLVAGVVLAGAGATLLAVEFRQRRTSRTAARLRLNGGPSRVMVRVDF